MKYVVCGTLVPPEFENRIEDLSNAGNRFLMNFVRELSVNNEVKVFSYIGVNVEKKVFEDLKESDWKFKKNEEQIGSFSIDYFYKTKDKITGVLRYKRQVKEALKEADCIVTYNATYGWIFSSRLARKLHKKSVLLLADYSPVESYDSFIRKSYARAEFKAILKYDIVVGLSQKTKEWLNPAQKFICVEGGIDRKVYDFFNTLEAKAEAGKIILKQEGEVNLMYAGLLEPVTGIDQLLVAFSEIKNDNLILMISGKGSLEQTVIKASKEDPRIKFLGCVPYEDYLCNLRMADILINPRNMALPENTNNFPSKIMEYLATGKKIISTRFPGNKGFENNIIFCDSSVESIRRAIEENASPQTREDFTKNRQFAEKFLWKNQVKRIQELVEEN